MIDWNRVTELRDEVGIKDFGEVVELFLEEVDEVIERLESSSDRTKIEEDLHFLKGSSMNLGLASFASLCQAGEAASAKGAADAIDLNAILTSYKLSRAEFTDKTNAMLQP
ncbi:MAG: hypothetical protein ACJAR9_000883 [Celeribacter sp.]|jgi:hypothetical protein